MPLPTSVLQSLVSRNRTTITNQHFNVDYWKFASAEQDGNEHWAALCHKQVALARKDIAKLAVIQKNLKKELAIQIAKQRVEAQCAKVVAGAKAYADECY